MPSPIPGIHHVTAIATDPRRNLAFYTEVLGLRLVKKTVNFDDPGTYHLYYGDDLGRPGTILTFFPWPLAVRGSRGVGQVTVTSVAVPAGSLGFWAERLAADGIVAEETEERLGEEVLTFLDPDGLKLELVAAREAAGRPGWQGGPVPPEHAVRGVHSVTLTEQGYEATAALLTTVLGFEKVAEAGNRFRFEAPGGGSGARVDVLCTPAAPYGRIAAGSVHHVAFRVADEAAQREWRERLVTAGLDVTPVLDRQYFRSIYFREPGGVLFEIATDPPGFTLDEAPEELGSGLELPPWLERHRERIESTLPALGEAERR
jgi:glyoxalase family protein